MESKILKLLLIVCILGSVCGCSDGHSGLAGTGETTEIADTKAGEADDPANPEADRTERSGEGQDLRLKSPKLQEYTDEAIRNMLQVTSSGRTSLTFATQDNYEPLEDASQLKDRKPYEVVVRDPDLIADSISFLMDRYFCSYLEREYQQAALSQASDIYYYSSSTDIQQADLLAGDENEFVAVVSYRYIYAENSTEEFKERIKDWGTIEKTEDGTWLYGQAAVHARMTGDYVYELLDIAPGEEVLQAFAEKYPENKQEYDNIVTVLPDIINPKRASVNGGQLQVTLDDGSNWRSVPLSTDLLFARGDQRDGALNGVQEGSSLIRDDLMVIAYGGSNEVPLSVMVSTDGGMNWDKILVSRRYSDVRRIFVSSPEDSDSIYLLIACGRTMSFEGNALFRSENNGASWQEIDCGFPNDGIHSLTTDFSFADDRNGFICIRSGEYPTMWYTNDGGGHWQASEFEILEAGYTMAYAPEMQNGSLILYVGQEDYGKRNGYVYKMSSADQGSSWSKEKVYYYQ